MRKFCVLICLLIIFVLPASAVNSIAFIDNQYINIRSIKKYKDKYIKRSDKVYSFWMEDVNANDGDEYFTGLEEELNDKVDFTLHKILMDCKNKKFGTKIEIVYNTKRRVIDYYKFPTPSISWTDVPKNSVADSYYNLACARAWD